PVKRPRRIMLYGVHGVGKTTWAAQAPGAIILPTEEGANDIECAKLPLADTFEMFMSYISALYSDPHDYSTVIVDSLDWLERLIWSVVCKENNVETISDISYGRGYDAAIKNWDQVLSGLDALRNDRGMMVIVLSHSVIATV